MKTSILIAAFAALAAATSSGKPHATRQSPRHSVSHQKRAVFTDQSYNDLSISGGTAGTAKAEAEEKLAGLPEDLTTVEQADLTFLFNVNQICNDAENGAFNTEIIAAGPGEEALALQRGKIKNKVLKITATILMLEAQLAQGLTNVTEKLEQERTKLEKNIGEDEAEAGQPSTAVLFDANTSDPEATAVEKDQAIADQAGDVIDESGGQS